MASPAFLLRSVFGNHTVFHGVDGFPFGGGLPQGHTPGAGQKPSRAGGLCRVWRGTFFPERVGRGGGERLGRARCPGAFIAGERCQVGCVSAGQPCTGCGGHRCVLENVGARDGAGLARGTGGNQRNPGFPPGSARGGFACGAHGKALRVFQGRAVVGGGGVDRGAARGSHRCRGRCGLRSFCSARLPGASSHAFFSLGNASKAPRRRGAL
jgi:hypothetical protein